MLSMRGKEGALHVAAAAIATATAPYVVAALLPKLFDDRELLHVGFPTDFPMYGHTRIKSSLPDYERPNIGQRY
jgi:hypothetical protein